jgi:hypothetical protein
VRFALAALIATVLSSHAPTTPGAAAKAVVRDVRASVTKGHNFPTVVGKVASRNGRTWLVVGVTIDKATGFASTRALVYRWSGSQFGRVATIRGDFVDVRWLSAVDLTGSPDPDFALEGCGAGDNNCLTVISDVGGRWHAIPFEYGYRTSVEVNGVPQGHLVWTELDDCGCAGGPSSFTWERFSHGVFAPTDPPGGPIPCDPRTLELAAEPQQVQLVEFNYSTCAAGWAIAIGRASGLSGRAVALFSRGSRGQSWELMALDNGNDLPAVPAYWDVPLSLLETLTARFGSVLAPESSAARLIAGLHTTWPDQNGIVDEHGSRWLVAPIRLHPNGATSEVELRVYRWNGTVWRLAGPIPRAPAALDLASTGGWFAPAATTGGAVAFRVVGSDVTFRRPAVVTNAGGRWHVRRLARSVR